MALRIFIVFAFLLWPAAFMQPVSSAAPSANEGEDKVAQKPSAPVLHAVLSERYLNSYSRDTAMLSSFRFSPEFVPMYHDSVYAKQIAALQATIPLTYNKHVREFIDFYSTKRRPMVAKIISRSYDYFPVLEDALKRNNMPPELVNLAAIESALDTNALSRCGALGLWQFMPGTARLYNLEVNKAIDERKNIIKSTDAAVVFLKQLHDQYGDWMLAIAAYNCGPGKVNQALKSTIVPKGKKKDFWAIMDKLPRETRGYVPGFIAMCYLTNNYHAHNIKAIDPSLYGVECIPVKIDTATDLQQLSKYFSITPEEIAFLNPAFEKNGELKGGEVLSIPKGVWQMTLPVTADNLGSEQ